MMHIELYFVFLCDFVIFYLAQNTTYFVVKIYRMIDCNIVYIMVFFLDFLKMFVF
jgi:hypothetical protein